MSYYRSAGLSWLVLAIVVLFLGNLQAAAAQPDVPPSPPVDVDLAQPITPPQPEKMAFQPPSDANELSDFLPPAGEMLEAPLTNPLTTIMPNTLEASVFDAPVDAITRTMPITAVTEVSFNGKQSNLVSFEGGEVAVVMEADTVNETAVLEFTTIPTPAIPLTNTDTFTNSVDSIILQRFQLDVVQGDEIISDQFEKPVRIVVDMRSLTGSLDPVYDGNYFLAYADENEPGLWHDVPITIHQEDGLISAEVMHFSTWAGGARPERWNPVLVPPVVSEFSGAATYSYPIEVPPGRHGLQPSVSLSYNSRSLDGATDDLETGDLANGWSLAQIAIVRRGVKMEEYNHGHFFIFHPDEFSLVLNGTSHFLTPAGDAITNGTIRYYAKDAPGLQIWRYYDASLPTDGLYWVVTTADGIQYRMGYTADSEEYQQGDLWYAKVPTHWGDSNNNISAITWNVDTVTDAFGNQMQYNYYNRIQSENVGGRPVKTRTSRLKDITYNYPTRVTGSVTNVVARLGGTSGSAVKFRAVGDNDSTGQFINPISSVYIFHNNAATPIKEIRISSQNDSVESPGCNRPETDPRWTKTLVVTAIRLHTGTDADVTTADGGNMLPAVTFEYTSKPHYNNGKNCFSFRYLYRVHNGYGGMTSFAYSSDNRSVGSYHYYGGTDTTQWPSIGYNYFVTQVTANDGRGNTTTTDYAYKSPCYGQSDPNVGTLAGATACYQSQDPKFGNITGFKETTVTTKGYSGETLNKQITTFSQDAATNLGQPTEQRLENASGVLLNKVVSSYRSEPVNGVPNAFTYMSAQQSYTYDNGETSSFMTTRTEYGYYPQLHSTVYQKDAAGNPVQLGQLTHIYEYKDGVPYRLTRNWYQVNNQNGNWVVRPTSSALYDGDSWNMVSATWNYYDGSTSPGVLPASGKGTLTRVRQAWEIPCNQIPAGQPGGCAHAYQTIDSGSTYDAYGNATTSTTYQNYGYRAVNSSWGEIYNLFAENAPDKKAQSTSIAYDGQYYLYPTAVTNPLGQATLFEIYGFNGVAVDGFQKQPGLLKKVTPPTGVASIYEYDPFGRLWAVYDSEASRGDIANRDDGDPVTRYRYWDNSWNYNGVVYLNPAGNAPFVISEQKRTGSFPAPANSSSGFAFNDQTFFDGFGRPIQTRSIWHWVEGQNKSREIISTTAYDARGNVMCQSAPFDVAFSGDRVTWPASAFVTDTCASKPHSATTYDALGRAQVVTAPDGTFTKHFYSINNGLGAMRQHHNVVDANQHRSRQSYDALGQLVHVTEFKGDCGNYWGYSCASGQTTWADDAYTVYQYNLMGSLTSVTDAAGNVSSMTYDALGRKTGMVDPDMGIWSYGYDAVGNLISQVDANTKRLCFTYDTLNRLTYKRHDSNNNGCDGSDTQLAYYAYFSSGTGKVGQLSEIRWSGSSTQNRETFNYDTLGRLTTHTRIIDSRSYTMGYGNFDTLNRPKTITYPTGEAVTMAYDREGANSLISNTGGALVDDVRYNARGQMTLLNRSGSARDTTYSYFGQYDAPGGDLGDSNFRLRQVNSGNALQFSYTYDKGGNIKSITDNLIANTQTFGYDALNRLTTASAPSGTGVDAYNHTYAYNQIGNMTNNAGTGYGYGDTAHKHAVTHLNNVQNFWYDANGNMTKRIDGSVTYNQHFDVENRLTSVEKVGSGTTTFAYDASGQRVKTVKPDGKLIYTPFPNYEEELHPKPVVEVTVEGQSSLEVAPDTPVTLAWSSTYADSCRASGDWEQSELAASGTKSITNNNVKLYTYTITCDGSYGSSSVSATIKVTALPIVTFTSNKTKINPNESFTLSWTSNATSCAADGVASDWTGSKPVTVNGSQAMNGFSGGSRTYYLKCNNVVGSTTMSVTIEVPWPTVNLTANNQTSLRLRNDTSFTLSWSSSYAASCVVSGDLTFTGLSGNKTIPGGKSSSRTYTVRCTNGNGSIEKSVTITWMPALPYDAFASGPFDSNTANWYRNRDRSQITILSGIPVLEVWSNAPWEGFHARRQAYTLSPGSGVYFRFLLADTNHEGRFALTTDKGGFVGLVFYGGNIYPDYNIGNGDVGILSKSIPQQANVWYRAYITIDKLGRPEWHVIRETDSANYRIAYRLDTTAARDFYDDAHYRFNIQAGTTSSQSTLYLSDYYEATGVRYDGFDSGQFDTNTSSSGWYLNSNRTQRTTLSGVPVLKVWGNAFWEGLHVRRNAYTIPEGGGIHVRFQLADTKHAGRISINTDNGGFAGIIFHNGTIYPDYNIGSGDVGFFQNSIPQQANVWYRAYITTDKQGRVNWQIYREDNPSAYYVKQTLDTTASRNFFDDANYKFIVHAGTTGSSSTMYISNYKEGPYGFTDGSSSGLDTGATVAAAAPPLVSFTNDWSTVPMDLKRTGHLSRMDNRVAAQTNGGYVIIQRSTYALAGQTIAVRVSGDPIGTNNGLFYMYSDHLGSASAIQKNGSTTVEQARYLPFGGWRTQPGNLPTNRGFTGHVMNNMGSGADNLGLIYMNARYYVSAIGRFASADTIVPNPTNPQTLNRYSYTRNSPLNLIDPTGHRECGAMDGSMCGVNIPEQAPYTKAHPSFPYPKDEIDTLGRLPDPTFRSPLNPLPNPTPGRGFDAANHPGVDYGRNEGTPIYSSTTGIVVISDSCSLQPSCLGQFGNTTASANGGYGNVIIVEYGYDFLPQDVIDDYGLQSGQSLYVLSAHMVELSDLPRGSVVQGGTKIGGVGNTGNSAGNHLHTETRIGSSGELWDASLCTASCRDTNNQHQTPWEVWRDDFTPVDPEIAWP